MPDVKFSNQYPYTDFHELNLDWVIKEVKYWSTKVGKTIQSISLTGTVGLVDTYTINYSDGSTSTFDVTNGNGITSVAKTGTVGLVDTYTITFQDGSTTAFEVHNGTASIDPTLTLSDYAADAKVTGDAIDDIRDAIGVHAKGTKVTQISGATYAASTSANVQTSGTIGVKLINTAGYDTYYFVADRNLSLYFKDTVSAYVAICYGENYTGTTTAGGSTYLLSSNPVRYRLSQNNLPTENNPLTVNSGDVIAITVTAGGQDLIYGFDTELNPVRFPMTYEKTATSLTVKIGTTTISVQKVTNPLRNVDVWRIISCVIDGYTVWLNSDAESVVQLLGESDFIGGYHGNELQTGIKIYVDGNEINENDIVSESDFKEIQMMIASDVYSIASGTKVFDRHTLLRFNQDGIYHNTMWEAVADLSVAVWFPAMLSCEITDIVGDPGGTQMLQTFYTDFEPYPHNIGTSITNNANNEEATFITSKGTLTMKPFVKDVTTTGRVAYYSAQSREKAYFYGINNPAGESVPTGTILSGGSILKILAPEI